jgi:hypothetical protein
MRRARRTQAGYSEKRLLVAAVYEPILSLSDARRAAKDTTTYLLWVDEREAAHFHEPGWEELQPHRQSAVLFINRLRESKRPLSPAAL